MKTSPGQTWVLQSLDSNVLLVQGLPPGEGGGLLHSRVLTDVPPPQDLLHGLHVVHSERPPST